MVLMRTDVLVVGGGLGGVAAALAAARAGRSVILTEEFDWLGGQLTSQAVPRTSTPGSSSSAPPPATGNCVTAFATTTVVTTR